jgi:hypothetical protein
VIGSGKKLNFGPGEHCDRSQRWRRRGNSGKPSEQRVLLDLRNQAVVIGALRIRVEEMVKLGRYREREGADPQQQHQAGDGKPAPPLRMLRYAPELHSSQIMHEI